MWRAHKHLNGSHLFKELVKIVCYAGDWCWRGKIVCLFQKRFFLFSHDIMLQILYELQKYVHAAFENSRTFPGLIWPVLFSQCFSSPGNCPFSFPALFQDSKALYEPCVTVKTEWCPWVQTGENCSDTPTTVTVSTVMSTDTNRWKLLWHPYHCFCEYSDVNRYKQVKNALTPLPVTVSRVMSTDTNRWKLLWHPYHCYCEYCDVNWYKQVKTALTPLPLLLWVQWCPQVKTGEKCSDIP